MGYWIKSYTDILDDPKYFKLSTNAQLAMHECFLIAKKLEKDELTGILPSLEDIAFYTRKSLEFWEGAIKELIDVGIIIEKDNGYLIKNYIKRQTAIPDNERMKQYRKRINDERMNNNIPQISYDNDNVTTRNAISHDSITNSLRTSYEPVTTRNGEEEKRREETEKETEKETEVEVEVEKEKKKEKNDDDNPLKKILLTTFIDKTGIKTQNDDDLNALDRLVAEKVSKNDLIGGILFMQKMDYPILGLRSVLNPCLVEKNKRVHRIHASDNDCDYKKYATGKYAKYLKKPKINDDT